jgi:hypothetical protein
MKNADENAAVNDGGTVACPIYFSKKSKNGTNFIKKSVSLFL